MQRTCLPLLAAALFSAAAAAEAAAFLPASARLAASRSIFEETRSAAAVATAAPRVPPPSLKARPPGDERDDDAAAGGNVDDGAGDGAVKVGSKEYLGGFVTRSVDEEPPDRVSGEALLAPTLRLAGAATAILGALFLGFMASNGLL